MFVENLVQFDHTDFLSCINHFTTHPWYWKICIEYILTQNAALQDCDEVKLDLLLVNRNNCIFPPISANILPKVLILCYLLRIETLAVIYWNSYVALNVKEKN